MYNIVQKCELQLERNKLTTPAAQQFHQLRKLRHALLSAKAKLSGFTCLHKKLHAQHVSVRASCFLILTKQSWTLNCIQHIICINCVTFQMIDT